MNLHVLADRGTALLGRLFAGRDRFFARDLVSDPLVDVIDATRVDAPGPDGPGTHETPAETPACELDSAFRVARWPGPERPTLIYLQGSGERAFDFSSRSKSTFRTVVLDAETGWEANLIVVRAPFHQGPQREYARAMGALGNFTAMIAAMVVLADALVGSLREQGSGPIVITGISLGGWATNLHAARYGTADAYIPLLAGAALDDLFLRSSYRRMAAASALGRPDRIETVLNFEAAFRGAPGERVFPLLARHDQFIRYEPQRRSYGDIPVTTIDRGHVTAAGSPGLLREHVRRFMPGAESDRPLPGPGA